jgi:hypothetical protein
MPKIIWQDAPQEHDYPAAADFLSLLLPDAVVQQVVDGLRNAPIAHRKAKDVLRSSGLPLLPETNLHVAADLDKVAKGKALSPVLLVRGDARVPAPLVVADGYHRVCTAYHLDENSDVPCRLADFPGPDAASPPPAA